MAKACQLFSGSTGNSIFISCKETKILVDAGVSAKRLDEALLEIGENPDSINAVFVTHEHTDHSKGLRVFASRHNIPVIASQKVMKKLFEDERVNDKNEALLLNENMELGGIEVIPFEVSHDSVECFGFRFNLQDGRSVSICTDTGYITNSAKAVIPGSDLVFLESNHEITMLENGPYPYILKQRILSRKGHLSNADCAEFAAELVKSGTTRLILSHISRENNIPEIARLTALSAISEAGFEENRDFRLSTAPPVNEERAIIL